MFRFVIFSTRWERLVAFVRKKTKNKKKQLGEAKKTTIEPNYFMNKISRKIYGYADGNRSKIT